MFARMPPLEIENSDPFCHDKLRRKESADALSSLIRNTRSSITLSVEAPWGFGKTTFLSMWAQQLRTNGFSVVQFNAWKTDFTGTPLISLVSELHEELKQHSDGRVKGSLSKLKKVTVSVVKRALPVAVRVATAGVLAPTEKDANELTKAFAEVSEGLASEFVENYLKDRNTLASFRNTLETVASQLPSSGNGGAPSLIVCIDELDRCRPTYAVEMLETVKHLFDVPGVVFVLAIDREQLCHTVRTLYGAGADADNYLRRFIDIQFRLPTPDTYDYSALLFQHFGLERFLNQPRGCIKFVSSLFKLLKLDLRTQEQVIGHSSIALLCQSGHEPYSVFLFTLAALRTANLNLYERLIHRAVLLIRV